MKATTTIVIMMLVALFAGGSSAKPSPTHTNARDQLPEQASDRAQPPSKPTQVIVPPLPPPPPVIPPVIAAVFTSESGSTAGGAQAQRAIASATQTIKTKLAAAPEISIITMTATRTSRLTTRLRPPGRVGDMEILRFRFNDRFGRRIGIGTMLCRWTAIGRRLCWGEAILPRGKLVALGSSQTRVLGEFAVVGGTGVYLFQQGMMTWRAINENKFVVRVLLAA